MQQPIYQEQQSNQQGTGQQMLLCPVRLVYETQILVQPGDQIQPNQTIFINPHNPPPWIQNRPQNQVLYVQQMAPNNLMPQVQQQAGQNQLYMHQNFNNFQQIMPQQIISQTQHEEVRSANVQMANMLSRSAVQNLQSGHSSNNTNIPNESTLGSPVSNFGMVPPYYANTNQISHNQINFIHTHLNNKHNVSNVQTAPKQVTTNTMSFSRNIEMQPNVYRPIIPQHTTNYQHDNKVIPTSLPQSITMVPMQNMPTFQRANTNNAIDQNVAQIRPIQSQSTNASSLPQPMNTVSNITNERILRKVATVTPKGNNAISTVLNTGAKNAVTYSYRPIQPRPQQQRNSTPNLLPNTPSQIIVPMQPSIVTNNNINTANYTVPSTLTSNYVKSEQIVFNRKRKSESPDETQKKMAVNNITQNIAFAQVGNTNAFHNIGVNTASLQKTNDKAPNPISINQNIINSQSTKGMEIVKENLQHSENQTDKDLNSKQYSETEKLLRNTVFTQARNRVLSDKQEIVNTNTIKVETKASETETLPEKGIDKDLVKDNDSIKEIIKSEESLHLTVVEPKKENNSNESDNQQTFKEINLLGNSKMDDGNGFVLTHVLDGYVIQESNIAFPIRKPLKEKTIPHNVAESEIKTEDSKNVKASYNNSKIFSLSFLHLNENEVQKRPTDDERIEDCEDKVNSKDHPFAELKPATVKTWTVEQLSTHLLKYHWVETVSVLREHEIDGESLFLVSKNQLTNIGVNEDHASLICEFVRS